jgi:two-component system, NtrC family, sensor kinase
MSRAPDSKLADFQEANEDLRRQLAELAAERDEALEQQAAMAEVMGVINSSPGNLEPVFDAMLAKALGLCGAAFGVLWTYDGERIHAAAVCGAPPAFEEFLTRAPHTVGPDNAHGRLLRGEPVVHIADVAQDEAYRSGDPVRRNLVELAGGRTLLAVPLRKDGAFLGDFVIYRQEVRPFSDRQIALLQNFAAQAVIAMENARLLTETREALEQQTATAEVLQVINTSPGDLVPVFQAMLQKAHTLCEASFGALMTYDGARFHPVAHQGTPVPFREMLAPGFVPGAGDPFARMIEGAAVSHIHDLSKVAERYRDEPLPRSAVDLGGVRTLLIVPLRKDNTLLGVITAYRQEVRPFTDRQIVLLQNFGAQAVIAMENARLLDEIRTARDTAEKALAELRATQQQLVVQQKMAALGQLTAGIAHEIKNPLNFVNNFAGLSVDLLDELRAVAAPGIAMLDDGVRAEIDETVEMLSGNLDKIAEHGRRADNIVQSMLEHSRGVSGERRQIDLNSLVEEALNLAYHGARAQDATFNITLERDYASALAPIELAPREMTRVLLNLFGNGFYATNRRARTSGDAAYRPLLRVATRETEDWVEVRVRDNGTGIANEHRDKLFQPFFTTKPTGEGTGLGLSISYDIVTQQHGGTIKVDSEPGAFTEFTVRLPRHRMR